MRIWSAKLKFPRIPASFVSIGSLFFLLLEPGHNASDSYHASASSPAYIARGHRVEAHYQVYSKRLADFHKSLTSALRHGTPDRLVSLQAPEPVQYGYQILPKIMSEASKEMHSRMRSIAYSWPWTDRMIQLETRAIARAQSDLRRAQALDPAQSIPIFKRLAREFRDMSERHKNIDAHIKYNRFWQAAVASDRPAYDHETLLHNDILERQGILDGLKNLDAAFGRFSVSFTRFQEPLALTEIFDELRRRAASLTRRINGMTNPVQTPDFVALEQRANQWIFRVPIYTDIEDQAFVASAKKIIESAWQVQTGTTTFRVELEIVHVTSEFLYANSEKPSRGQTIDVRRHLRRFPNGAAILTSGAVTTHVQDYAIVLGPHSIAPGILAHEFGHILGLRDTYVRGYKDLGRNGFQVMEVAPDAGDIMASPGTGSVLRGHFETILARKSPAKTQIAPEREILPARGRSKA